MEYRQLGQTDMRVSAIGVGGYPFGPPMLGQAETTAVIDAALEHGINFFDTSDVYGQGQSEDQVGVALEGKRDKIYISTKFNLRNLNGQTPRDRIFARCEEALRKLKTDHIDLFQVHYATPDVPHEELIGPLNELVEQGKVRYIGNCNTASWRIHEQVVTSAEKGLARFQSTQNHYSLLYRHAELELMPFCRKYEISLIPYFPLGGGWLTGTYRPGEAPPAGSRADIVPTGIVTRLRSDRVDDLVPKLETFAGEHGHTIVELALAWVLSHPEVGVTLCGFDKPEHVAANVTGADWQLTEDERAELDSITDWWFGGDALTESSVPPVRPTN
ncbi:MAG: aldo/keto reductase [Chloroflexi bacterium]|nr:aldo/keto reductase [Chloroflexota bacterium]MDA1173484.1 aldo/keto reductase [Chloroflexota bacterium]